MYKIDKLGCVDTLLLGKTTYEVHYLLQMKKTASVMRRLLTVVFSSLPDKQVIYTKFSTYATGTPEPLGTCRAVLLVTE